MTSADMWKIVKVYECPNCGQLVRDMNAACNHKCTRVKTPKDETIEKLELLKAIFDLQRELKATAWYKRSERKNIKLRIWELDTKRPFN